MSSSRFSTELIRKRFGRSRASLVGTVGTLRSRHRLRYARSLIIPRFGNAFRESAASGFHKTCRAWPCGDWEIFLHLFRLRNPTPLR